MTTYTYQPENAQRSRAKMWWPSSPLGTIEEKVFTPIPRRQRFRILKAAKRFDRKTRKPGCPSGALGIYAIELLEFMLDRIHDVTGQLDVSITTMMAALGRAKSTIERAKKKLRAAGFLIWVRRYVPTGREGAGPQVQQTSNAYRIMMPPHGEKLLWNGAGPPPPPKDFEAAKAERAAQLRAYADWEIADAKAKAEAARAQNKPLGPPASLEESLGRLALGVAGASVERESRSDDRFRLDTFLEAEKRTMSGVAAAPRPV